jgi:predicted RNA-binding Zn-ribbon protein involved in translation (DUF1610 family)
VPGERPRYVGVAQDVTDTRAREEDLRQAQKLEAVGALASAIAHDFGNLLQGIMGCTSVALASETLPERRREYDRSIRTARERPVADPPANRIAVTCAICNTTQQVPRSAGRFDCANCHMVWQFAKCEACNEITHVRERKTTWRCPSCRREQASSWGGAARYVHCTRCKTGALTAPYDARFTCPQCRLVHLRCDCGQYTPVVGWRWRTWRCPRCRRLNPPPRETAFDVLQVALIVIAALLGIAGLYLVSGLAR